MLRFSTRFEWRREPSRRNLLSHDSKGSLLRKLVYSLATLGTILFAVSALFFPTGHATLSISLLCVGVFSFMLSALLYWLENAPQTEKPINAPLAITSSTAKGQPSEKPSRKPVRPKSKEYEPDAREDEILWYLFQSNVDRALDSIVDNLRFQYSEEALHRLERLARAGYVLLPRWVTATAFPQFALTPLGREYVISEPITFGQLTCNPALRVVDLFLAVEA